MKKIALSLIFILLLTLTGGCANIHDDATRTKTEGAGMGALAGAGLGALIGGLAGGSAESALIGAGIGVLVGGVGGFAYGSYVADQKAKYANEEDWLNASVAEATRRNSELLAYNNNLKKQMVDLRKSTDSLIARYKQKKVDKARLLEEKKRVDNLKKEADQHLAAAKNELKAQQRVMADLKQSGMNRDLTHSLAEQIENLKVTVKKLEKQTEELASMSEAMAV